MLLLTQLRWLAVLGQLITVMVVHFVMGIDLPLLQLLLSIATLAALNVASYVLLDSGIVFSNRLLVFALLFDVIALTVQLRLSGGITNPFVGLFLLQVVLGAILLTPRAAWSIAFASLTALALLAIDAAPIPLPAHYADDSLTLYRAGNFIAFVVIAVLLVAFVTRIARNLRERDLALAASRERAAEEDHIVRIGLLASGAAHELGTPLATLSVILGDVRRLAPATPIVELADDVAEMEHALSRCKAIVSDILMAAGEARGEAANFTSVRAFLQSITAGSAFSRDPDAVALDDRFGTDVKIIADPALKQVIGNIVENAAHYSPEWIGISAWREADALMIEIADRGPGFAPEILQSFGRPYRSTRGRPGGGLGLFLLANVVRKLGGEASAGNRATGGAFVRIALPLSALTANRSAAHG